MTDVILKLESIRDDQRDKYWHHLRGRVAMGESERRGSAGLMGQKPFVKHVVGIDRNGRPTKRPVEGKKSYAEANAIGSRGVFYYFTLHQGGCYLIQEQSSRYQARQYYAIVNAGRLHEVNERQAIEFVGSTQIIEEIRT